MTDFDDFYAAHYADLTVQVSAYDDPAAWSAASPGTWRPAAGGDYARSVRSTAGSTLSRSSMGSDPSDYR
jgi:hypothetical protein